MDEPQREAKDASTIKNAVSKLLTTHESIELRKGVRPADTGRIKDACFLIRQPAYPESTKAEQRRHRYQRFLRKVEEECGPESVIVSSVGLGQTTVGSMREFVLLRLPLEIKKHAQVFRTQLLGELVKKYLGDSVYRNNELSRRIDNVSGNSEGLQEHPAVASGPALSTSFPHAPATASGAIRNDSTIGKDTSEPQRSLSGRVFALSHQDAREIVMSNQIAGGVWMTDPYDNASQSFITVPISDEIALYFSAQRRQIM